MLLAVLSLPALAAVGAPEQEEIKLGFIKLTDMAPLAVAYERGYFEDEGLYVTLEAQANWKILLDRVIDGELDGAQMLAGQPLAAHIGIGTQAELVTAFAMDLNGNAITVAKPVWAAMAAQLPAGGRQGAGAGERRRPQAGGGAIPAGGQAVQHGDGVPRLPTTTSSGTGLRLAASTPVSTHPSSGTTRASARRTCCCQSPRHRRCPPPWRRAPSPATAWGALEPAGARQGIGVPVITDQEIWRNNPEKVFGVTREWAERHPNTHVRLVKALLRAAWWLDAEQNGNRREAAKMLARPEYVGPTSR